MTGRQTKAGFLLALATVALLFVGSFALADPPKLAVKPGQSLWDFGLPSLAVAKAAPKTIYLTEALRPRGEAAKKLLVLNFGASWCEACKREIPELVDLHHAYRNHGLGLYVASIDDERDGALAFGAFMEKYKGRFPVVWDNLRLVSRRLLGDQVALPVTLLVDGRLRVLLVMQGGSPDDVRTLERAIRATLKMPPEQLNKPAAKAVETPDDSAAPPKAGAIKATVSHVRGKLAWVPLGRKHGIRRDLPCRFEAAGGKGGACQVVAVVAGRTRLSCERELTVGDTIWFGPPETGAAKPKKAKRGKEQP